MKSPESKRKETEKRSDEKRPKNQSSPLSIPQTPTSTHASPSLLSSLTSVLFSPPSSSPSPASLSTSSPDPHTTPSASLPISASTSQELSDPPPHSSLDLHFMKRGESLSIEKDRKQEEIDMRRSLDSALPKMKEKEGKKEKKSSSFFNFGKK